MSSELKGPKKDAATRLRNFYNHVVRKPLTKEDKEKLREFFKEKNQVEQGEVIKPKKGAKKNQEVEIF